MFRLLPIALLFLSSMWASVAAAGPAEDCDPGGISNAPQCIAGPVFEGDDAGMSLGSQYLIAIRPPRDTHGDIIIPKTISEALRSMHEMLPHWYLNALRVSQGENECDVVVNGLSYTTLVSAWERANWQLQAENSILRKQFEQLGFRHNDGIEQALVFGFCQYVKQGEAKALEIIRSRVPKAGRRSPDGAQRNPGQ